MLSYESAASFVAGFDRLELFAVVKHAVLHALTNHWRAYLLEALGLMAFMLGAGAFDTLFQHPDSPVVRALPFELARRVGLGVCMGLVMFAIVTAIGKRTGAHINPAVTCAFWRQGKIGGWDAGFYTLAQFAGAVVAPILLLAAIGPPFAHEDVRYSISQPGPSGAGIAWMAEFAISFALMFAILLVLDSRRLAAALPAIVGMMIALYVTFEAPLSGMSMNPARSFGSALTAGEWDNLWIYFTAPVLAMLFAVEAHRLVRSATEPLDELAPHYPRERADG